MSEQHPPIEFTGERYEPEIGGQIALEHLHRYGFASRFVRGRDVLDVASGEGYGSDLLLTAGARSVTGVDIAQEVVARARFRYGRAGLDFTAASAASLPFEDASFDVVVSFETIEHHDRHEEMLSEIARVLRPGGLLVMSSPNKQFYSIETGYRNPFHVKELFRDEFLGLVGRHFAKREIFGQRVVHGSLIAHEAAATFESERVAGAGQRRENGLLAPLYDIVVATNGTLPEPASSLFEMQVHEMDPASYYGVHLPERVNEADRECAHLRSWLSELQTHADALTDLRSRLEAREAALQQELGGLHHQYALLDGTLQHERAVQLELVANLQHLRVVQADLQRDLATRDERLQEMAANLQQLRRDVAWRDERLKDANAQLAIKRAELQQILSSNSWKLSAPLRWLRAQIGALRRGEPRPSFRQVLGATGQRESAPAPAALAAPRAALEPVQGAAPVQRYLDALFANDESGRAPDYLPRSTERAPAADALRAKLIAFYLPQFHPFEENDAWWGKGFTEWTNVTRAKPQFVGHDQPQLPADLGFYDLRLPEVIRQQVELARQYGVFGFCFHYYWFAGHRLLERPLDLFLQNTDIDFPFCICWANENWTRRWDGHDNEILIAQDHTPENDLAFIQDLEPYLRDARYIRIDGKPLVIVYRPSILPDCAATLRRWRDHCRDAGIGEIFLAMAQFDSEDPRAYGFDAALEFPPHKLASGLTPINGTLEIVNRNYRGHVLHYQSIVDSARAWPTPEFPLIRTVFPGWDNEARRPGAGYTFAFSTPARYRQWLDFAVGYAEQHPVGGESIVMVNAWNEWAEGAHLEPDRRHGHAYLHETRAALERQAPARPPRPRIVLVSHDAQPHGAQVLALNFVRELDATFGFDVDLVLLGPGPLGADFAAHATVHDASGFLDDPAALEALAERLHAGGARAAIANTTVSGLFAGMLKRAGMRVVALVHELPGIIGAYQLEGHAATLAAEADHLVFAAPQVLEGFRTVTAVSDRQVVIRPQGLFRRSRYLGLTNLDEPRRQLRHRLGVPSDARIVLGVGYGDRRKGLDLFGEAAAIACRQDERLHFVWVGHYDDALMSQARTALADAGLADRLHATGLDFDTDDFYAGADIFALTSREDPFPSVVLEALAVGLPVLAFAGTGGAEAILRRGCGRLVPQMTAADFAGAVADLLGDDTTRRQLGDSGRGIIAAEYGFHRYVFDVLALAGEAPPRVSVVIPNYNYASLLHARLSSIAAQELPPYEVIVLDDCSTDDSVAVLEALQGRLPLEFQIVRGGANSGSVFRQWLKGAELARGDYVWIAEADDLSDPQFLSSLATLLASDPSLAMAYCQSRQVDENGQALADDYRYYTDTVDAGRWDADYVHAGADEIREVLSVKNTIPNVSAVLFRRKALVDALRDNIGRLADMRVAGDWLTYVSVLERGRIGFVSRAMNAHRRHATSVTGATAKLTHLLEVLTIQRHVRERYAPGADVDRAARDYAQDLYRQFGLEVDEACSFADHPRLALFLADTP